MIFEGIVEEMRDVCQLWRLKVEQRDDAARFEVT
jgi:hypothetical protein